MGRRILKRLPWAKIVAAIFWAGFAGGFTEFNFYLVRTGQVVATPLFIGVCAAIIASFTAILLMLFFAKPLQ